MGLLRRWLDTCCGCDQSLGLRLDCQDAEQRKRRTYSRDLVLLATTDLTLRQSNETALCNSRTLRFRRCTCAADTDDSHRDFVARTPANNDELLP